MKYSKRALIKKKQRDKQLANYYMIMILVISYSALIIYATLKL